MNDIEIARRKREEKEETERDTRNEESFVIRPFAMWSPEWFFGPGDNFPFTTLPWLYDHLGRPLRRDE